MFEVGLKLSTKMSETRHAKLPIVSIQPRFNLLLCIFSLLGHVGQ